MPPARPPSIQDQVLANILAQPVGPWTVGTYGLPREFLAALADRIICASYQDTFRAFPSPDPPPASPKESQSRYASLITPTFAATAAALGRLPEDRPPLRGFRPDAGQPFALPVDADRLLRATADLIATRLTPAGLIATAAEAIRLLPQEHRANPEPLLRAAGLPIDLLDHFTLDGVRGTAILHRLAQDGAGPPALAAAARFDFRPTLPGFRAMTDDGSEPPGALRLHITGETYWGGIGAGSSLEVASQLARAVPRVIASIHTDHAPRILRSTADWAGPDTSVQLIAQPLPVTQWAQDNARAGRLPDGAPACLLPRYASRGEDGSILLPGDTLAGDNLAAAGLTVRRSPLLFQGGNILCVRAPRTGERLLLIGEAEIHRNTVLGLSPSQVIDALKADFTADRAITLPQSSFHIDFDVTIIRHEGASRAFVNDTLAGATALVDAGLAALDAKGVLDGAAARTLLREQRPGEASRRLDAVYHLAHANPAPLIAALSSGPHDPGAANLRLLLVALDLLLVHTRGPEAAFDANHAGCLHALARLERLRASVKRTLEREGWAPAGIPSLSEQRHGYSTINLVNSPHGLFMPAWCGVFAPVDAAARATFQKCLPGTQIAPICSAETQRRAGGPHCAAAWVQ